MSQLSRGLLALADGDDPLDDPVALFIVQLVFILVVSRVLGFLFRYIKQPQVIAEVITGIVLGPTLLGLIPNYMSELFSASSVNTINVVANVGLIFFMFLIGIELDPDLLRKNAKSAAFIAFASMAFPFGLGALVSILLYNKYGDHQTTKFSTFLLFCGVAMSITAFPVLARILTETRLTGSKVGLTALSAAAVNDVVAWILLAVVVSIAQAKSPVSTVWTLLIMIGFLIFMAFVVRPLLIKLNNLAQTSANIRHRMVALTFILVLMSAWFTEVIGIHAIFGGFVMGVVSPREHGWPIYITERIEDVILILLLPLYFTVSGINTNLRALNDGTAWGMCFLVITLACFGKIVGSLTAAKILGNGWRESLTVGVLMNTKGLVELIVLNLGRQAGVLTTELFSIFVMMAVLTTMLTSPLLHFIWIRVEKKKSAPYDKDSFSVMMCVSNQASGLAMVSIAGTLAVKKKKKFTLQALHVTEVTDNPSSYFFAHRRPPPHFLELVRERTRALSLPLRIKQIFAVNVASDIDHYCRSKHFDLILVAWNEPIIEKGGSKIKQVLAHTNSTVGVVINRGIDEIVQIHRVLVVHKGEPHESDSLKLARMMCRRPGVQVTLISSVAAADLGFVEEPANFIFSENPMATGTSEATGKYDLIVIGISREWSESSMVETSELLVSSSASVLIVHPKMEGTEYDEKKAESEDKPRLFWGSHESKLIPLRLLRNKSRDFSNDLESGRNTPDDGHIRKSKSKLRMIEKENQSFTAENENERYDDLMPDYKLDRLRLYDDVVDVPPKLSATTSLQKERSGSPPIRISKSQSSIPLSVDIPTLPPPPVSHSPKSPEALHALASSSPALRPVYQAPASPSAAIVTPPASPREEKKHSEIDDDLVFVE